MVVKRVNKFGQGSPPPFRPMPERKTFLKEVLRNLLYQKFSLARYPWKLYWVQFWNITKTFSFIQIQYVCLGPFLYLVLSIGILYIGGLIYIMITESNLNCWCCIWCLWQNNKMIFFIAIIIKWWVGEDKGRLLQKKRENVGICLKSRTGFNSVMLWNVWFWCLAKQGTDIEALSGKLKCLCTYFLGIF